MELRERQMNGVTILELTGRLTVDDRAGQLKDAVAKAVDAGARQIMLDLSGVKYIDSTRLGELIAAHVTVTRRGGTLKLISTPPRITDLLEMAGLHGVFQHYPSLDDALRTAT